MFSSFGIVIQYNRFLFRNSFLLSLNFTFYVSVVIFIIEVENFLKIIAFLICYKHGLGIIWASFPLVFLFVINNLNVYLNDLLPEWNIIKTFCLELNFMLCKHQHNCLLYIHNIIWWIFCIRVNSRTAVSGHFDRWKFRFESKFSS